MTNSDIFTNKILRFLFEIDFPFDKKLRNDLRRMLPSRLHHIYLNNGNTFRDNIHYNHLKKNQLFFFKGTFEQ